MEETTNEKGEVDEETLRKWEAQLIEQQRAQRRRPLIELGDVTPHNIKQLKRLNQVVFPVSYNDKFYKDVLEAGELAKLAYYNDIVVGAVCCRIDTSENSRRLYIMTLGCLAPYRRLGIGTKMVEHVLNIVERDGNFDSIFLHVQVNNDSAIEFYKKFGFEIVETKEHYYKRIEPADAHVLQKTLRATSNLTNGHGEPIACSKNDADGMYDGDIDDTETQQTPNTRIHPTHPVINGDDALLHNGEIKDSPCCVGKVKAKLTASGDDKENKDEDCDDSKQGTDTKKNKNKAKHNRKHKGKA